MSTIVFALDKRFLKLQIVPTIIGTICSFAVENI
jgi:hypothetical protein